MADNGMKRRDFLKAAATTPVLGAFGAALYSKESRDKAAREEILQLGKEIRSELPVPTIRSISALSAVVDGANR